MLMSDEARETSVPTLDDLLSGTAASTREYLGLLGSNAGRPALAITLTMSEAIERTKVYNDADAPEEIAQRELVEPHANGLGAYLIHAAAYAAIVERRRTGRAVPQAHEDIVRLMGPQDVFVMAPWTANLRGIDKSDLKAIRVDPIAKLNGVNAVKVSLSGSTSWSLLDGQHRRGGLDRASGFLDYIATTGTYPHGKGKRSFFGLKGPVPAELESFWDETRAALARMTVTIDLHIGLSVKEERQIFADLNNKARKVATDLSYQYDRGNPIMVFVQEELKDLIGPDQGGMTLTELAAVNAIAFQNKTNVRGSNAVQVAERKSVVKSMWDAIADVPGFGEEGGSAINEAAVQKAIAKLVYDFGFAKNRTAEDDEHLQTLLNELSDVDFGYDNAMWDFYTAPDRVTTKLKGIEKYLPRYEGKLIAKDLGVREDGRFVFSVKHNDVYPVIGDMIRYRLKLPARHA